MGTKSRNLSNVISQEWIEACCFWRFFFQMISNSGCFWLEKCENVEKWRKILKMNKKCENEEKMWKMMKNVKNEEKN